MRNNSRIGANLAFGQEISHPGARSRTYEVPGGELELGEVAQTMLDRNEDVERRGLSGLAPGTWTAEYAASGSRGGFRHSR